MSRAPAVAGLGVVLLAFVLRAWPLHVAYLHPDQEAVPRMALGALVAGSWRPDALVYPSGLFTLLRATYGLAAHAGRLGDGIAPLAAFDREPWPFLVVARAFSCLAGTATVALTACIGTRLLGAPWGVAAGLVLAVSPLHVRDSHYGSLDVPAGAFALAALAALARARAAAAAAATAGAASGLGWLVVGGALGGAAIGFRYQTASVLAALPALLLTVPGTSWRRRAGDLALASAAALASFALLSPYTLLEPGRALADLRTQAFMSYHPGGPPALPLPTQLTVAVGGGVAVLALVGVVPLARRRPGVAGVAALVTLPYLATLLAAPRTFVRYLIPLLPLVALAAAAGARALAGRLPRRAVPAGVALLTLALLDPLGRSVALVRLLGTTDTRHAAGAWLEAHVPAGETVLVPGVGWYSSPILPPGRFRVVGYLRDGSGLDRAHPQGRWVVTAAHPGLASQGLVPPALDAWLAAHATRVAEFRALAPGGAPGLFEQPDANFLPLRDFGAALRPGPDIVVWRLHDAAEAG